jgi:hypothetical protein
MEFLVDLRYVFPPLINLTLRVLIPQAKYRAQDPNFHGEIFVMACDLSLVIAILLFLFTSVKLPLTLSVDSLRLRSGDFSGPLTLSLMASLFFPLSLFWLVFLMLLIVSPWYEMLLNWIFHTLQAIPALIITCIPQRPQVEREAIVPQVELEAIVIEENNEANI